MDFDVFSLNPFDTQRFLVMLFAGGLGIFLFFWAMDLMARKEGAKLILAAGAAITVLHFTGGFKLPGF